MKQTLTILMVIWSTSLAAEEWVSDSGGEFGFEATFEGEALPGRFTIFDVRYSTTQLVVTVDLDAADMGDPEMNSVLFDSAWFGVNKYDTATYTASTIDCGDGGQCVANGKLELKGITKAVDVPFEWTVDGEQASMRGEVVLDRTRFDVGTGEWSTGESIGLDVTVTFDIRLQRAE